MTFSITGAVNCDWCGAVLGESSEDCDCSDSRTELTFRRIGTGEERSVKISKSAKPAFGWEKFARSLDGDDPRAYVMREPFRLTAFSYDGSKDLRELASYTETENE